MRETNKGLNDYRPDLFLDAPTETAALKVAARPRVRAMASGCMDVVIERGRKEKEQRELIHTNTKTEWEVKVILVTIVSTELSCGVPEAFTASRCRSIQKCSEGMIIVYKIYGPRVILVHIGSQLNS